MRGGGSMDIEAAQCDKGIPGLHMAEQEGEATHLAAARQILCPSPMDFTGKKADDPDGCVQV